MTTNTIFRIRSKIFPFTRGPLKPLFPEARRIVKMPESNTTASLASFLIGAQKREFSGSITPTTVDAKNAIEDGYQLTEKDLAQLATPDEDYVLQTWEVLKTIISVSHPNRDVWTLTAPLDENRIEDLKRVPSDLKRYIAWSHQTKKEYGSIQAFVLKERLHWTDLTAKDPEPFKNPGSQP